MKNYNIICLSRNSIFNPQASSSVEKRKIILGETTNIIELDRIRYQWAYDLYRTMAFTNFWIPEEINMGSDKKDYEFNLSEKEKRSLELILSFLIALDSFQVNMLKEFARFFTAPELVLVITSQEFQEGLHSYSYQFILESIVDPIKTKEIYDMWRKDEILFERNKVIAEIYENFINEPTLENLIKAVIANYILEGLYFYVGFAFIYSLGRLGKMKATVQQIKYINRDELTHVSLFKNIILSIRNENEKEIDWKKMEEWIYDYFKFAVDKETNWGKYVINNGILGLNDNIIEQYVKYLANKRLVNIGLKPLYENISENPLGWIDSFRMINNTKTDFFQAKPQTYVKRNELKW